MIAGAPHSYARVCSCVLKIQGIKQTSTITAGGSFFFDISDTTKHARGYIHGIQHVMPCRRISSSSASTPAGTIGFHTQNTFDNNLLALDEKWISELRPTTGKYPLDHGRRCQGPSCKLAYCPTSGLSLLFISIPVGQIFPAVTLQLVGKRKARRAVKPWFGFYLELMEALRGQTVLDKRVACGFDRSKITTIPLP
ncbi:hypothetical protein BD779DRAFT_1789058 [Infundibulicybe gibba]|nr:hypothetical protein BD779DRAFT_1789058 [Infundibulicybe gibba]